MYLPVNGAGTVELLLQDFLKVVLHCVCVALTGRHVCHVGHSFAEAFVVLQKSICAVAAGRKSMHMCPRYWTK
jgi:hypothetical protein